MKNEYPSVSLIVAVYNEEKDIKKFLDSVLKLNYPKNKLEVIIIDDGSTDKTVEIIKKYPFKLIKGKHMGIGFSQNLGLKKAKGEFVMFLAADMVLHKNCLKEIVKPFKNPRVGATDAKFLFGNEKGNIISKLYYLRSHPGKIIKDFPFVRVCRKEILKKLGGIKPKYGYYDDYDLVMRIRKMGYDIVRVNKAIIWHNEPETLRELWRQHKWAGRSIIFLFNGYPKEAMLRLRFPLISAFFPISIILLFLDYPIRYLELLGF